MVSLSGFKDVETIQRKGARKTKLRRTRRASTRRRRKWFRKITVYFPE
jgi:hypothetical protein